MNNNILTFLRAPVYLSCVVTLFVWSRASGATPGHGWHCIAAYEDK